MRWDAWVTLVGWLVFGPLYLRAAYREMLKGREEEAARLHEQCRMGGDVRCLNLLPRIGGSLTRRRAHDDENLANP